MYIDGYKSVPVLNKKAGTPMGNNYTGELVGGSR